MFCGFVQLVDFHLHQRYADNWFLHKINKAVLEKQKGQICYDL